MTTGTPEEQFRHQLLDLAFQLTLKDLKDLKFLCKDDIPGAVLSDIIETPRDLFEKLIEEGKIGWQNTTYLEKLLNSIRRGDLIKKLQNIVSIQGFGIRLYGWPRAQAYGLQVKQTNFIGREALVEKITSLYLEQKPMVVVVAPPGFGKTCVATHVGHAMKDKGYKVIYVSLQQEQSYQSVCCNILKTMDPEISLSDDIPQQTKNLFKSLRLPTLLILDNTEDIQNSSSSREFKSFIEFLGSNVEKLKIFLGTRKSIAIISFDHESINLPKLEDEASLNLLLALAGGTSLKQDEAAEKLAIRCAGVPLLIKIAAGLVKNGYDPSKLAKNLQEQPYNVLISTEHELMKFLTNSVQVFLDSLSKEKLVALVQLSCFPAQFTENIVNEIFFKNEVKCSDMLSSLHANALVQLDGKNYSLHPLIQTFCREEQERMECKKEGEKAMEEFSNYYFAKLEELHRLFVRKDCCPKALKQFFSSKMNLLQALENALKCNDHKIKVRCIDAFNASINLLGKIMHPGQCLSVYKQLYDEAEKMQDRKRMSECLVSRGFRYMCEVNHGEFSQDAFDAFEKALSLLGGNPVETEAYAHCLSKLGLCYIFKKETEKGMKLMNDALRIRYQLGDKVLLAASYVDKAIGARLCHDHDQAIKIFENQCLPAYKDQLGNHPWVASLLNFMSKSHQILGCLEKAIECNEQALEIRKELLGDHQDTARSYVRHGELFERQGNMEKALEEYKKAASIQGKVLGRAHEETKKSGQAIKAAIARIEDINKAVEN